MIPFPKDDVDDVMARAIKNVRGAICYALGLRLMCATSFWGACSETSGQAGVTRPPAQDSVLRAALRGSHVRYMCTRILKSACMTSTATYVQPAHENKICVYISVD